MGDLFTIDASGTFSNVGYYKDKLIEKYQSLIWTERYIEAGDVTLVLAATTKNLGLTSPGTLLGHDESRIPMRLHTRSIKDGMITAKGKSLETFLNNRDVQPAEFTDEHPGAIFTSLIDEMQTYYLVWDGYSGIFNLPYFFSGEEAVLTETVHEKVARGPAYDKLLELAKKYNVDIGVYRVSRGLGHAYDLHFSTYRGLDRTSNQSDNEMVRFSPHLDNLANVEQLESDEDSTTRVLVLTPEGLSVSINPFVVSAGSVTDDWTFNAPFMERYHTIDLSSGGTNPVTEEMIDPSGSDDSSAKEARLHQIGLTLAKAWLRTHRKTFVIDGEISPNAKYKYYSEYNPEGLTTYRLGDTVEIQGHFGGVRQGIVSEHIRSYDSTGSGRSYPTVSVGNDSVTVDDGEFAT